MDNLDNTSRIVVAAPNLQGQTRVDLRRRDFDALIWGKSYDVFIDKAIRCPCRNVKDTQGLSACKNCGGSGWVFYNRRETKVTIQSMNRDTKFKEWSEELRGTAKITFLNNEAIQYMDKVTVRNAKLGDSQVLYPVQINGSLRAKTSHPIVEVEEIFLFEGTGVALKKLVKTTDYVVEQGNWITLDSQYDSIENPTIAIRYQFNPSFYVMELMRSVMVSKESADSGDVNSPMPLSAVAKLTHYALGEENFTDTYLYDNSYTQTCDGNVLINVGGNVCSFDSYTQETLPTDPGGYVIVFNSTLGVFQGWNGTEWVTFGKELVWSLEQW